jgi:multiple sugar transport system substrate-binding protein
MASASTAAATLGGLTSPALVVAKPLAQDVTTISFMGWGGVAEDEGVRAAIEVFQSEQSAVQVEWLHTPDSYNEKLLSNVAAGTPPDTAFISQSQFRTLVHDGLTMDITDLVQADPVISQPDYFIEPQETERSTDQNGRWHGIGSTWTALHFYFNGALLEEAGVEPPQFNEEGIWDWDTFVESARLLTKDSAGRHPGDDGFDINDVTQWGVFMATNWWMMYDAMAKTNGGKMSQDGLMTLDTAEAIAGIQAFADLIHVHHVMPEAVFLDEMGMSAGQMIENGRLAMVIDGSWTLADIYNIAAPLGVGPVPRLADSGLASGQGHLHSILNGSQNPDSAWSWLSFLARPFYQTHFCKLGLWIPNQTAMLTDEGLEGWITEGVHPANYRDFVADYVPQYMSPSIVPAGYPRAEALFVPAVEQVMSGTAQAQDVMPDVIAQANEILQAEYIDA